MKELQEWNGIAWWRRLPSEGTYATFDGIDRFIDSAFIARSFEDNASCFVRRMSVYGDATKVVEALNGRMNGRIVWKATGKTSVRHGDDYSVWVNLDYGLVHVNLEDPESDLLSVNVLAADEEFLEEIIKVVELVTSENPKTGQNTHLYMLVADHGDLDLRTVKKNVGVDLVAANYTSVQQEAFAHVVSDLKRPDPCGRITILHGTPGTGKTYFLRGVIQALASSKVQVILIPSASIQRISSPELIPVLKDRRGYDRRLLIMEDADNALIRRAESNMTIVESILNLTDGLLGEALDLRIVATTNAKKIDIDPAIVRVGRLCRQVEFDPFGRQQAQEVADRLAVGEKFKKFADGKMSTLFTLAEIYGLCF